MSTYLVTGVQGQDGFILAEQLIRQGHKVIGVGRRRLEEFSRRDAHLIEMSKLENGLFSYIICDLRDAPRIFDIVSSFQPDFVINLAALSSPVESWTNSVGTFMNDSIAVMNLLEAIRLTSPQTHLIQACTSAIFKNSIEPASEISEIDPLSPYAAAKYAAKNLVDIYRQKYQLSASNVIMFNHESEMRSDAFVTRKITKTVAEIKVGKANKLELWTLRPIRDWGWAEEFMQGIYLMSMKPRIENLVLATGKGASIQEFAEVAFSVAGLSSDKYCQVKESPHITGSDISIGNPAKALVEIGWKPRIFWPEIAEKMFSYDYNLLRARE